MTERVAVPVVALPLACAIGWHASRHGLVGVARFGLRRCGAGEAGKILQTKQSMALGQAIQIV